MDIKTNFEFPRGDDNTKFLQRLMQDLSKNFKLLSGQSTSNTTSYASSLPIGSVIHSMLTLAQFQSQAGSGWVLMNGQSCVGSLYGSITGFTSVPDATGRVLRGKNNGSTNNPDGDLALGTYQADQFASHSHDVNAISSSGTSNGPQIGIAAPTSGFITTLSGGNETRMKNITVNIFIRIN